MFKIFFPASGLRFSELYKIWFYKCHIYVNSIVEWCKALREMFFTEIFASSFH
jgi:hypothetical protein